MAAKHPFPLPRTTSKMQLASQDNLPDSISTEASAGKRKPFLHQMIGFSHSSKDTDVAMSPRSVLSGVGSGFLQIRSPTSGLESVLSGSRPWEQGSSEGVGLRIISSLNATEEDAAKASKALMLSINQRKCVSKQSEPISISHSQPRSSPGKKILFVNREFANESSETTFAGCYGVFQPGIKHTEEPLAYAEGNRRESIFSTTAPTFSCNVRIRLLPEMDFLNSCFFCKRNLGPGKDIFMYRGDRAFCSAECRYQHIVLDERKERCSASSSSVPSRTSSNHRGRIVSSTPAAAA